MGEMGEFQKMIEVLASVIEYRSIESFVHIRRVRDFTRILAKHLAYSEKFKEEISEEDVEVIAEASVLHDIGKICVPENVLQKPGRLTLEEFEVVKAHAVIGANIAEVMWTEGKRDEYFRHCRNICRHHHERWNGTGYPDKLKGLEIPISARIVSIVDVFDALVSARCYKPEFTLEETYKIINTASGVQFQPEMVEALMQVRPEFEAVIAEIAEQ